MTGQPNINEIKADILSSVQKAFPSFNVTLAKEWSPHGKTNICSLIIEADHETMFDTTPHQGVAVPFYISLSPANFAKVKMVDRYNSERLVQDGKLANKICVEVSIDKWRQVLMGDGALDHEGVMDVVDAVIFQMRSKPMVETPPIVKVLPATSISGSNLLFGVDREENYKKLEMMVNRLSNIETRTGFSSYVESFHRDEVGVSCYHYKPNAYYDFCLPRSFFVEFFDREEIDYRVDSREIDEKDCDCFGARLIFSYQYLCANSLEELAAKIDRDVRELMLKIDLAYCEKLYAHIAQKSGVTFGYFDDAIAERFIKGGELYQHDVKEWRMIRVKGELADDINRRNPGYPFEAKSIVGYWDTHQIFRMHDMSGPTEMISESGLKSIVKRKAKEAKKLGFLLFEGTHNITFYMKPIAGDFDYEKNLPELCTMLTYETGLLYNGKDRQERMDRREARELAEQIRAGRGY